jgi:hypothetical protein
MPPYAHDPYTPYPSAPAPQPPKKGRGRLVTTIIGVVVVCIILFGSGIFFVNQHNAQVTQQQHATATALAQSHATATARAQQNSNADPYVPGPSTLVLNDPMHDNSKGYAWNETTVNAKGGGLGTCAFTNGAYHVSRTEKGSLICHSKTLAFNLSNLALEANLTINQGDYSGIAFRMDNTTEKGYVFVIGAGGDYVLDAFNFNADINHEYTVLSKGNSPAIKRGWHQANLAAIVANGSTISTYINHQPITSVQDTTYTQGAVGIYGYGQSSFDVMTTGVRAWQL